MISGDQATKRQAEMVELHKDVYAYVATQCTWGWSNAGFVVGEECALVVDTLFTPKLTENFLNQTRAISDKKIKYLVNTHHDGDHCFGNHLLPEAASIAHVNTRAEILEEGVADARKLGIIFPGFDFTGARFTVPEVGFDGMLTINLGKRQLQLLYFGYAHSTGDIVVYLPKEKIVFCGDLLFYRSTPACGSAFFASWINALTKLAEMDVTTFIPGHGSVTDRAGLLECRDYLTLIYGEAKKGFESGLSPRETARQLALGEFIKWANPERVLLNVDRVYRECRGEKPALLLERDAIFKEMAEWRRAGW